MHRLALIFCAALARAEPNVVLLTFDGVRWQEFLGNEPDPGLSAGDLAPTFPYFWSTLAGQGIVYGDASSGSTMTVSNPVMISLPAYQSIMAGAKQPCLSNDCPRVGVETVAERLIRELRLKPSEVATFASWEKIPLAVENAAGATFVDAGAGGKGRLDRDTFSPALQYLKDKKPRFLFISLSDSDHLAHAGDYKGYLASLRQYDVWLGELIGTLDAMGEYGKNTTLLVTTDHGRGVGRDWKHHQLRPWAANVWLYARGPATPRRGLAGKTAIHSHVDIRPTIEFLLGLGPCPGCTGAAFPELMGGAGALTMRP